MIATRPILIAGPTASGKSALALSLAQELGGVVINADSMQVYSELEILSARPSSSEMTRARHVLYGFVPASEAYSVGRFVADAARALGEAQRQGQRPIVVGGTGLYFKALLEGLSPIPPIAADIREHWRQRAESIGAQALHATLALRDAEMAARLNPSDTQRIVRALEVLDATGVSLSIWQSKPGVPTIEPDHAVRLVMTLERQVLYQRADLRFDAMMQDGALAEAAAISALNLDAALPAMRALGVAPLIAAVRGEMPVEAAVERGKAETRQYIKRQETWAKRNMISWISVMAQQIEYLSPEVIAFIKS